MVPFTQGDDVADAGWPLLLTLDECWVTHSGWMRGETLFMTSDVSLELVIFISLAAFCFWSHPSFMTERWQLCFFLDWSPFVNYSVRILKFCSVVRIGKKNERSLYWGGYRPRFHPICLSVWMSLVCFNPCASTSSWWCECTQGLAEAVNGMWTL